MKIALYRNHTDNTPQVADVTWDDLLEALTEFRDTPCGAECPGGHCQHKYGPAWSPVDIEGTRKDTNVKAVTVAVFDLDHLTDADVAAIDLDGHAFALHSTHSHRPPKDNCYRLVMPLSRPVPARDWRRFLAQAIRTLNIPADPATRDLSRIYFLPSGSPDLAREAFGTPGKPIDVDAILEQADANHEEGARIERNPAPPPTPTPVDPQDAHAAIDKARKRYARQGDPKSELLDAVLKGKALAPSGNRDNAVNRVAATLAFVLPPNIDPALALHIVEPAIRAMPTTPEGAQHWIDKFDDRFRAGQQRRAEADAQQAQAASRVQAAFDALNARKQSDTEEACADPDEGAWGRELLWKATKEGAPPSLKQVEENVVIILERSPEWADAILYNEVDKNIEVVGGPLPASDRHLNVFPRAVGNWLQRHYDISLGEQQLRSAIALVARRNAYDPLREYLERLEWDGTSRIDRVLIDYANARTEDDDGRDITTHVERVTRMFFVSCVVRALRPGSQVDTVLVLEGKEGARKTSFFRELGGEWFAPTAIGLHDKDSKMLVSKAWIVELAELASLRRSDEESTKSFITTTVDHFRPPYGAVIEAHPRRAVLVGTVNPDGPGYLGQGERRRWWPVAVGDVDVEHVARMRDQLWAEAVVVATQAFAELDSGTPASALPANLRWWMTEEESDVARAEAASRAGVSAVNDFVAAWWFGKDVEKRPTFVTTTEVATQALKLTPERLTTGIQMSVGNALREMGFLRRRKRVNGSLTYAYVPTEELRTKKQTVRSPAGTPFDVVSNTNTEIENA